MYRILAARLALMSDLILPRSAPLAAVRTASETPRIRSVAAARTALLAAVFVLALVAGVGTNPYSARASVLQLHGALSRVEGFGIISHRGAAALAPENTLAAMRLAFDQGVDFVEADLHLTADGVPVLMHDPTLDRTTTGSGAVAAHTLAQLEGLDAGSWFDGAYLGERVPTLEAFLDELAPTNSRALIELKGVWSDEQVASAVAMLGDRYLVDRVAFESFEVENLERLAVLAPEYARVMLTREWNRPTLELAAALKVSAIGARNEVFERDFALIDEARVLGIGTMVYTLNTPKQWAKAREHGIDLVITDDPVSLDEWRQSSSPSV
ncbi:glycerophosphoryl diester phosphodiesterase [Leucobacter komagatae]|uniref:Glycerophosphoryl diester phosphodiesterase n=2 Tax=Leucobacter komagatae TaxID=55969 RepID=A0A542Y700_9MICO|nr:glycerophosphoryl diester phosphodiesterase [Leucobacter komagatae]